MKAFKKNQTVIHFMNGDSKGTWLWTRSIVKSCGAKRMTLEHAETGEMMGCNYRPDAEKTYSREWNGEVIVQNWGHFTLPDMSDEEAVAVCLERGAATLVAENEHYDRCLAGGHGEAYDKVIHQSRAALHEPRAMKR